MAELLASYHVEPRRRRHRRRRLLFGFVAVSAFLAIWAERKVSGRIQDRLGPTRVGPFGWLQTLADGIKLLVEGRHHPRRRRPVPLQARPVPRVLRRVRRLPRAAVRQRRSSPQDLNVAVFFMLAVMSSEVFGIILAGYGSASKWSLFGGMREAAQVVSYEVPRAMCVLVPVSSPAR